MKTIVYLLFYMWHADVKTAHVYQSGGGERTAMNGGPVLEVKKMSSLRACEVVGIELKRMVDSQPHSTPATYRCIEIAK